MMKQEENSDHIKQVKDLEKQLALAEFKLERTEKLKKTLSILLEETIEELEQKRKAVEAQNHELEIESSLERVRTSAMGINKPDDLLAVCEIMFTELQNMGFDELRNSMININDDVNRILLNYDYSHAMGKSINLLRYDIHPVVESQVSMMKSGRDAFSETIFSGKDLESWKDMRKTAGEKEDPRIENIDALYYYFYSIGSGFIGISTFSSISEAKRNVLKRFRNVFDLAYQRYMDVTQAEAQAREARIEAALERVRSRAMAMHSSAELAELVATVFKELTALDFGLTSCIIWTHDPELSRDALWVASREINKPAEPYYIKPFHPAFFKSIIHAWKQRDSKWVYELTGEEKEMFQKAFFDEVLSLPDQLRAVLENPDKVVFSASFNRFGAVEAVGIESLSEEKHELLNRFGLVFDQTYTRFLDLQKAEEQAKEAHIELALERVRARTMAMQKSDELPETSLLLFQQFKELGETAEQISICIINEEQGFVELSATFQGNPFEHTYRIDLDEPFVMKKAYTAWKEKRRSLIIDLTGKDLYDYNVWRHSISGLEFNKQVAKDEHYIINLVFFSKGMLSFSMNIPSPAETLQLIERFAAVFDLTYTRFLDLQRAEANTRDAIKQASIDRIRAQTASMRTTADLDNIIPLIWKELSILEIQFIRCGVFFMDEEHQEIYTYLSTPDGKALAAFHLPYNTPGTTANMLRHWRTKEMYSEHWDEAAFIDWTKNLAEKGIMDSSEKYLTENRPDNLYLHFFPFLQGMLYVGCEVSLKEEELSVIQTLADAFSTAYARYEDFTKLESAKLQIENTLTYLKLAQAQLIQSEKMASLGELTAGIAHEIQNPLNFINNFSEVNAELIDELGKEIDEGNFTEAKALAKDIKENEEKIVHHGRRADTIVKGMLQHSRSSSGVKEPTDINALADEYLRLAYHGLRAKDKTFNATVKTNFDESIGKINIVPQDIGRVILNLITNAFYTVAEKKKNADGKYEPTVSVSTKKIKNKVEVKVEDNGDGIPQNVLDKIFQPFFTTKPTGMGTGLGLSLSYDIVKAHGGLINVETKNGEGSEFILQLPA